jgi:hypothetical protein
VSVAAFDFEPDACVPELASSDDLADHVGDQLPAPDPPRCDVTPHDSTTRYPDDFTQVTDAAKSEPRTGHKPPIGSALAFSVV